MSTLPVFPPATILAKMHEALAHGQQSGKYERAIELLQQHPGLARTDAAFRQEYGSDPLIFDVISHRMPALYKALLEAGSSPLAIRANGINALEVLFAQSYYTPHDLTHIETALAHPDCTTLEQVNPLDNGIALQALNKVMSMTPPYERLKERRKHIFTEVLTRTPLHLLQERDIFSGFTKYQHVDKDVQVFILQAMANRGLDLTEVLGKVEGSVAGLIETENKDVVPGLLAAGFDEDAPLVLESGMSTTGRQVIDESDRKVKRHKGERTIREKAAAILDGEIERVAAGTPLAEVLLTQEGRASWQAQGMVMSGLMEKCFAKARAGADSPGRVAAQIYDTLSERQRPHFDPAGIIREDVLARPEDSATVKYLRGGAEVTKGGVA